MGRDIPFATAVSGVGSNNERDRGVLSKYSRRLTAVSTPLTPSSITYFERFRRCAAGMPPARLCTLIVSHTKTDSSPTKQQRDRNIDLCLVNSSTPGSPSSPPHLIRSRSGTNLLPQRPLISLLGSARRYVYRRAFAGPSLLFAHYRIAQGANAGDFDLDGVTVLDILGRTRGAHPHDVAWIQGQVLRHPADDGGGAKDGAVGLEANLLLAVDADPRLGCIEIEIGLDPRPHRLERVGIF